MRNNKGQFSIIAALFVAVILIATVIMTYSTIRTSPIEVQPQILSTIDETNLALKEILGFTIGYYGSVLQVTGNSSYARELAINYTYSGLENIARMHPELGASFNLTSVDLSVYWYSNCSWSRGRLAVSYNLTGLGLSGMNYEISCQLKVNVTRFSSVQTRLNVTKDENEPLANLGKQNFKFYCYVYENSTWMQINPTTEPSVEIGNTYATYTIDIPPGVDTDSYIIQVEDQRGLVVTASSFNRYTYTLNWTYTNLTSTLYSQLKNATDATMIVELLQNGTMRWLGQNILNLTTRAKPVPPIPVKAIHVNQTINGINQEVPFQIEDWASDYKIPLGLTNNASIFGNRHMLVFLANPNVTKVTIWWNGSDTATQTPYAYTNRYFRDNPDGGTLNNGKLRITLSGTGFTVTARANDGTTSTTDLMRINGESDTTPPEWAYAIINGTVRSVVHGEPEYGSDGDSGGVGNPSPYGCYNFYAHVVIMLPANATYYTYQLRLIFLNSTDKPRKITEIRLLRVSTRSSFSPLTENGTLPSGYPNVSTAYDLFYNMSGVWQHHFAQLNSSSMTGFGIMFPDDANKMLYYFDKIAGNSTGALRTVSSSYPTERAIELLPVSSLASVGNFTSALDICWYGAVVTFGASNTPVYKGGGTNATGLWILVEYPPIITVTTEN
jgi:hypothetical protein